LVSVNRWSIDNQTKTVHRLLSIGTAATSNLSDHPPFLGSPRDKIVKIIPTQSSQRKEYIPLHMYSNYSLACHCLSVSLYMSTQEVQEEALLNIRCIAKGYHLCHFEVNIHKLFTADKRGECGKVFKVASQARTGTNFRVVTRRRIPVDRAWKRQKSLCTRTLKAWRICFDIEFCQLKDGYNSLTSSGTPNFFPLILVN